LYKWTSYPITVLLEQLYTSELDRLASQVQTSPSPFLVELVAILERALRFLHTGSAACLMRTIMDQLWVSRALLVDGLPCFDEKKLGIHYIANRVSVDWSRSAWPTNEVSRAPLSAAKASMLFNYGIEPLNVSLRYSFFFHTHYLPMIYIIYLSTLLIAIATQ
jgi:hypothetical protein